MGDFWKCIHWSVPYECCEQGFPRKYLFKLIRGSFHINIRIQLVIFKSSFYLFQWFYKNRLYMSASSRKSCYMKPPLWEANYLSWLTFHEMLCYVQSEEHYMYNPPTSQIRRMRDIPWAFHPARFFTSLPFPPSFYSSALTLWELFKTFFFHW